jgi:hypothetical protein
VAYRDRRVLLEQHNGYGLADDVAPADHNGVLAVQLDAVPLEKLHDPGRRARRKRALVHEQLADVQRMEPIHVLIRVDRKQDFPGIDLARQRKLDQDAVDVLALVQLVHEAEQVIFRRLRRELILERRYPQALTGLVLVPHIDLRCRIFTNEDYGKPRTVPRSRHFRDFGPHLLFHL